MTQSLREILVSVVREARRGDVHSIRVTPTLTDSVSPPPPT